MPPRFKMRLSQGRAALHSLGGQRQDFAFEIQVHPLVDSVVLLAAGPTAIQPDAQRP